MLPKAYSLVDGTYDPRCLKRYYFSDEVVDQLHVSDRILQHFLLKQLKPTFKHVTNPNCYHLAGPTGVKYATERVKKALLDDQPNYIIRADIKSFYKSIPHYKLIRDIKQYYDDPKVQAMLERIIKNPIDTPRGYINPSYGIVLRKTASTVYGSYRVFYPPYQKLLASLYTLVGNCKENLALFRIN